jgi:DNA-binding CsgD family transcriptional regulator
VVLQGDAGIGKTALLEDVAHRASDFHVCSVFGVESEMELPYAGLQQLCRPIIHLLADVPTLQRTALEKVFGLATGPPPDRFLVGIAVFDLVAAAARAKPLLWLVDDAHWLDEATVQAIGFVGRRLLGERCLVVVAEREPHADAALRGLPQMQITGLEAPSSGRLLDSVVTGPIDRAVRDRIIAETRGNPLALLELPRAWTAAEVVEGLSQPDAMPLAGQLELAYATRLAQLPTDTQMLLTLAAADPTGDPALLWSAAERLGLDWGAAAPAEIAGLIDFGGRVRFRHPLVRSASYRSAPMVRRLEAHRALAEVTDPVRDADRRAWHRASSTVSRDELIAGDLEQSAGRAKSRGGLQAAAALLERAATLTPDPARRADRTLAAARAKRDAGGLEAALQLLSTLESEPPSELRGALAEQLRGQIAFDQRRGEAAARLLQSAARRLEAIDPQLARDTHLEALAAAVWASGPDGKELIQHVAEAALARSPSPGSAQTADLLLDALARRATQGYEEAAPALLKALASAAGHVAGPDDVASLSWLAGNRVAGIIATETWDYQTGFALAEQQVRLARESGALVQLQFALNFLANNVVLTGDTEGVAALVDEEQQLSALTGATPVGYSHLLLDAFRGNEIAAAPLIKATIETATRDGQGRIVAFAYYVSAVLYNGLGRHELALEAAGRVLDWGTLGYQTLAAPELAEAASRVGDTARLVEVGAWVRDRAAATPNDWSLGIADRVLALNARSDEIDAHYRRSIAHLAQTPLRVEEARSHLLYGEWLRRTGSKGRAREHLSVAHDALTEMGIGGFAQRARRELAATTTRRIRRNVDSPSALLTSQERNVAQLANPEIGRRLFLSPRTVEWHLRNIFGKVGVTSRRQLRDTDLAP